MQETEIGGEACPRRPARVVPLEPSLRYRYYHLVLAIIALLLFFIILYFAFNTIIWDNSLFNLFAIYYGIYAIISLSSLRSWQTAEKRRQQAARYNLAVNIRKLAGRQPELDVPAMPEIFVITAQRRWLATWLIAGASCLLLYLLVLLVYSSWQVTFQALQQGVPVAVVILNNGCNLAILLLYAIPTLLALIFSPRVSLSATSDGLTCRCGYRVVTIPWQQARLFAVIGQSEGKRGSVLFYELASKDALIRWPSVAQQARQGTPDATVLFNSILARPVAAGEFPRQVQFLNSIIAERTGLPLYDLR